MCFLLKLYHNIQVFQTPPVIVIHHNWSYPHPPPCHNVSYRVSGKTVNAFVFQISQPPLGLKIPSWTIFNSLFHVDFENIQFFIIWLKYKEVILKVSIFC